VREGGGASAEPKQHNSRASGRAYFGFELSTAIALCGRWSGMRNGSATAGRINAEFKARSGGQLLDLQALECGALLRGAGS